MNFLYKMKVKNIHFLLNGTTTIFSSMVKNIIIIVLLMPFMTTKATHLNGCLLRIIK